MDAAAYCDGQHKVGEKLDKILAGEYDIAKAVEEEKALEERAQKTLDYFRRIIRGDDGDATDALGDELLARGADDVTFLNNLSWGIMTQEKVQYRNRGFALRLAKAAFDASDGETGFVAHEDADIASEDGDAIDRL